MRSLEVRPFHCWKNEACIHDRRGIRASTRSRIAATGILQLRKQGLGPNFLLLYSSDNLANCRAGTRDKLATFANGAAGMDTSSFLDPWMSPRRTQLRRLASVLAGHCRLRGAAPQVRVTSAAIADNLSAPMKGYLFMRFDRSQHDPRTSIRGF